MQRKPNLFFMVPQSFFCKLVPFVLKSDESFLPAWNASGLAGWRTAWPPGRISTEPGNPFSSTLIR